MSYPSDNPPRVSISIGRKINIGNYESVDIFYSLNNIPASIEPLDLESLMETGDACYQFLRRKIVERTAELRTSSSGGVADDGWT